MCPKPVKYLVVPVLLIPYIIIGFTVFMVEEPWWTHEVKPVQDIPKPTHGKVLRVAQDGQGDFRSLSEAVEAASPGDRIIVYPGVYRESVNVLNKAWLSIVGLDRKGVVLDGGSKLGNGVYVVFSPHVKIANMTIRNYLGNGVFFVNSDYFEAVNISALNNRVYGLNALASEKGVFSHVVAAGSGDSGLYIGEVTERCDCVIEYAEAYNNTLGYSGTRANGVVIRNSRFYNNAIGIAPNTLMPDIRLTLTGRWPLLMWASKLTIENNIIENNNNRAVKAAGFAASYGVPVGVGIALIGSFSNIVRDNVIKGHEKWGVAEWYFLAPPLGNEFVRNRFEDNSIDYWRDGWGFGGCSESEKATGDVPPPCSIPAALRITIPNPFKHIELITRLEVPGAALTFFGVGALAATLAAGWTKPTQHLTLRRTRIASAAVDSLVAGNIYLVLSSMLVIFGFGLTDFRSIVDGVLSLTFLLFPLAYFIWVTAWTVYGFVSEALTGSTLGKWLLGLRLVRDGEKPSMPRILVRNLLRYVDALGFGLVGILSILVKGRTIGELLSGVGVERR